MTPHFNDKNGVEIGQDDVIYDGSDYYRMCYDEPNGTYLLGGSSGYVHDLMQDLLNGFERIGTFEDCQDLLVTD